MSNSINSNLYSLKIGRQLDLISRDLTASFRKIASGSRITSAADDAAGLAISSSLRAHIRIFTQAVRNANDGSSLVNIQESALGELTGVAIRLKELAVQSANGSFSRTQRLSLDEEASQLTKEFNRLIGSTSFNGRRLFAPDFTSLRIQVGIGLEESLSLNANQHLSRQQGTGTFTTSFTDPGGVLDPISAYAAADFDGDGNIDLLTAGNDVPGVLRIALGNGQGGFGTSNPTVNFSAGLDTTTTATAGDIDGDGDIDIAALDSANRVGILINNGSGTFSVAQTFTQSGAQLKLQDLNSDGRADLIQGGGSTLRVYQSVGNGTFATAVSYALSGAVFREAEFGDINGDGAIDIIAATSGANSALFSLLGNGSGGFSPAVSFGSTNNTSIELIDVNHDGLQDIIAGRNGSVFNVMLGNAQASFQTAVSYSITGSGNTFLETTDVNNDGYSDIIAGTGGANTISVFFGSEQGTFSLQSTFSGQISSNPIVSDFNKDGVSDLYYFEESGDDLYVRLGEASATNTIQRFDLTTASAARNSLPLIDAILERLVKERGALGALQARIETATNNILSRSLNYEAADTRIRDIDIASESALLTKNQIRQQVASALLAQANAEPEIMLQIIQSA